MKDEKKEEEEGEEEIAAVKVIREQGSTHTPCNKESCSSSSLSIP